MVLWFKCQLGTGWWLILVFSQVFCVTTDKFLWLSSNEAGMHMRLDWIDTSHVKVGTTDPILILLSVKYGVATLSSCPLQVCLVYNCLGLGPVSQDMPTWWILRWCRGIWARLQRQEQLSCCSSAVLLGLRATRTPAMWMLESMLVKAK